MNKPTELTIRGEGKDAELAKKVVESIELHRKLVGLDDWYGTVIFKRVEEEDGGDTMETECWPQYKKYEITVDLKTLGTSVEYLHQYVRHELIHVLTWTYFGLASELCYKRAQGAMRKLDEATTGQFEYMPIWDIAYKALEDSTEIATEDVVTVHDDTMSKPKNNKSE